MAVGDIPRNAFTFPWVQVLFDKIRRKKRRQPIPFSNVKGVYAQCKEDVVILGLLTFLNIDKPYYVDIGAHHPYYLSNTALFYERGCKGLLIEANPSLIADLKKRERDTVINLAIADEDGKQLEFFTIKDASTLNTCDKTVLDSYAKFGFQQEDTILVECMTINTLLEKYADQRPNFISLDIEGFDELVINTLDFEKWGPEILCVETSSYGDLHPDVTFIELILSKGYLAYTHIGVNTIFIRKDTVSLAPTQNL